MINSENFKFRISPELKEKIREAAAERNIPMSAYVKNALHDRVKEDLEPRKHYRTLADAIMAEAA